MPQTTVTVGGTSHTFDTKKEMLIGIGREILSDFDQPMTLRQLYYRFVALDLVENKRSQYQYLSEAMRDARIKGLVPWDWIEDRTRETAAGDEDYVTPESRFRGNLNWFKQTPDRYELPRWYGQDEYVEVWVEKEALAGIFADVCEPLGVVTFPSKGYTSITMLKDAAERLRSAWEDDRRPRILYFGDFDPSGQDIQRNIEDHLNDTFGVPASVDRVALDRDQIDEWELPPQPAKSSDARFEDFVEEHGNLAVELDALPPEELSRLVEESVESYFDHDHYENEVLPEEAEKQKKLRKLINGALADDA